MMISRNGAVAKERCLDILFLMFRCFVSEATVKVFLLYQLVKEREHLKTINILPNQSKFFYQDLIASDKLPQPEDLEQESITKDHNLKHQFPSDRPCGCSNLSSYIFFTN